MKAKQIRFTDAEIRAILNGTKTRFRVIVKGLPESAKHRYLRAIHEGQWFHIQDQDPDVLHTVAPLYQPGDLLWVREAFVQWTNGAYFYKASEPGGLIHGLTGLPVKWKPSIHMPREASRITLEVTAVRCERLQDISEADAMKEGLEDHGYSNLNYLTKQVENIHPKESFRTLWQSIHGPDSWNANPWVWVYEFRRVMP